jgi:hypothetical protein
MPTALFSPPVSAAILLAHCRQFLRISMSYLQQQLKETVLSVPVTQEFPVPVFLFPALFPPAPLP